MSILEKCSVFSELLDFLIKNEAISWVILALNSIDSEEIDHFIINYTTAFLLNILIHLSKEKHEIYKETIPGGAEFVDFHVFFC